MAASFLRTNRGGRKLVYEGYMYHEQRANQTMGGRVSYWRCVRKTECPGRAKVVEVGANVNVTVTQAHGGHASNPEEVEATRLVQTMKRRAQEHRNSTKTRLVEITLILLSF